MSKNRHFYKFNLRHHGFLDIPFSDPLYGSFKFKDIIVRKATFFKEAVKLNIPYFMYMYEEDDLFYEFFSGRLVGKRQVSKKRFTSRVYSNVLYNCDDLVRNNYVLSSFMEFESDSFFMGKGYVIKRMFPNEFLEDIQPFIPYKEHMASEMSRLLDAIDAEYQRLTNTANRAPQKVEYSQETLNALAQLDSIISRK